MSFPRIANYYREFIKGYADKIHPMQQMMRSKGKKFSWTDEAEVSFETIKRKICEVPVKSLMESVTASKLSDEIFKIKT